MQICGEGFDRGIDILAGMWECGFESPEVDIFYELDDEYGMSNGHGQR